MRNFRRFAFFTTLATYFLIFMGGLVRVSGAGLGCPDWPRCFGRWIPPTSVDQLPPHMDPAQFNFVLAWIEYINRLCGMTVGLLILVTAVWGLVKTARIKGIAIPAALAAVLTAFQGWQGSVVVASLLEPVVVTVHTLLALLIVSLLIYATHEAYYHEHRESYPAGVLPKSASLWLGGLWLVAVVQVVLGTQIRSALEVIRDRFPLLTGADWVGEVGTINHVHMTLGILLTAFTWYAALMLSRYKDKLSVVMKQSVMAMVIVVTIQLGLGLMFIMFEVSAIKQVFHLWLASFYVGLTLLLFVMSRKRQVQS